MHRDILGRDNTNKIDLKEALDKGKGYLINKQTVLIDEAKASGSWNEKNMFLNTLKTLITEGTAGIRQLYKDYTEQVPTNLAWLMRMENLKLSYHIMVGWDGMRYTMGTC